MRISDVLRQKGPAVATIAPTATVRQLLTTLREHNIGAVVVTEGDDVVGIVSERDIVRKLDAVRGRELSNHEPLFRAANIELWLSMIGGRSFQ